MRFLAFAFFAFLAGACGGSVQVLERSPAAGAIAVTGSVDAVRSAADRYMRQHCSNGYTLLDEEPTSGGSWRMKYRCNEATLVVDTEARSVAVRAAL